MPLFEYSTELPVPPSQVFEFLTRVENLPRVSPRSPRMRVIEAPARLFEGARFTVEIGISVFRRVVVSEVTVFEEGKRFIDVQIRGPFRKWEHCHIVERTPAGSRMIDRVDYEPPAGLLGWILTSRRIEGLLSRGFKFRETRFRELLVV